MSAARRSENKGAAGKDATWKTGRALTTPEARKYSEWVLLVADLQYSLRRAELWKARAEREEQYYRSQEAPVMVVEVT